jgi:hypothetical protein
MQSSSEIAIVDSANASIVPSRLARKSSPSRSALHGVFPLSITRL